MGKLFKLSNGRLGPHPDERSDAVRVRHRFYTSPFRCSTCNVSTLRVTHSDNCMVCQRIKIEITRYYAQYSDEDTHVVPWPEYIDEKYNTAEFLKEPAEARKLILESGFVLHSEPCKKHGHVQVLDGDGECYSCSQMESPRQHALTNGEDTYISTSKCRGCDHLTIRNTSDKSCTSCGHTPNIEKRTHNTRFMANNADVIMSKDEAVTVGLNVFRTGEECSHGHRGFRYVKGGACVSCVKDGSITQSKTDGRETPDTIMMRDNPDMTISKTHANSYGFKVYRNGEECTKGHRGWRYISTGNCISCIREGT